MTLLHRLLLIAFASVMAISAVSVRAETGDAPREAVTPVAVSSPSPGGETAAPDATPVERTAEPTRSRPSDALMRALMVITSAGGNRPFPLVPR